MPPPLRSPERSSAVSANAARPPGMPAQTVAAAKRAFASTSAPVNASVIALRQPASRLAVTFSVGGGASPRTPVMRTRSGPSWVERDGVEARDGVGAQVARAGDLVEQLGRDSADGDDASAPGVLGDDRGPVGAHLGQREADALPARDLFEEGVVPAAALRAALNDVARHHSAGNGVEVGVLPPEGVQGRPDHQGGISHPARDHDLRAGRQRVGDGPCPQVGVGRDDSRVLGQGFAGVEVHEPLAGGPQIAQPGRDVVARHRRHPHIDTLARRELAYGIGQTLRVAGHPHWTRRRSPARHRWGAPPRARAGRCGRSRRVRSLVLCKMYMVSSASQSPVSTSRSPPSTISLAAEARSPKKPLQLPIRSTSGAPAGALTEPRPRREGR